uniref:RRM domain-containing protein n=1 Tax=Trypanosoma vivax (strain Y486) TaxID=1055687 RepID=G0U7B1_TRYVY|nr:conserved hypothetical protein [Trypanosoma vivax Y486]
MEVLRIQGLSFTVGLEFCRMILLRCFSEFGLVYDVLLDAHRGEALVSFTESASAQDAYLKMNGFMLFGRQIKVSIATPPSSEIPGCIVTYRPSRSMIIRGAPQLWVKLNLRHIRGVEELQFVDSNTSVVLFKDQQIAMTVKKVFDGRIAYNGATVTVMFLKRV